MLRRRIQRLLRWHLSTLPNHVTCRLLMISQTLRLLYHFIVAVHWEIFLGMETRLVQQLFSSDCFKGLVHIANFFQVILLAVFLDLSRCCWKIRNFLHLFFDSRCWSDSSFIVFLFFFFFLREMFQVVFFIFISQRFILLFGYVHTFLLYNIHFFFSGLIFLQVRLLSIL